ncbi:hypothetical protein [Streptomyces sp. ISL-86]|uniref:hypothetical protein n=1 Tax=Streptomyces sp. ISL-86 TaxID=2819187 RepID=UPI001BE80B87|nr:hypothetical protein [Streptomyces sp. ISL-86]MBT2459212.1 hypothetical protein [Streptomyces sp. ISL-86]
MCASPAWTPPTGAPEALPELAAGGEIVAEHTRCWARHQTITDPHHAETGRIMRAEHHHQRPAGHIRSVDSGPLVEVEPRELDSYDRLFTVIDGGKEVG